MYSTVSFKAACANFQEILTELYKDWFESAIKGDDLSLRKQKFIEILEKMKLSTKYEDEIWAASGKLLPLLTENPSDTARVDIEKYANDYVNAGIAFTENQPGLKFVNSSEALRNNPLNNEFYGMYDGLVGTFRELAKNPQPASVYFNDAAANDQARFMVLLADLVQRVQA
jgi:hypothetical protein